MGRYGMGAGAADSLAVNTPREIDTRIGTVRSTSWAAAPAGGEGGGGREGENERKERMAAEGFVHRMCFGEGGKDWVHGGGRPHCMQIGETPSIQPFPTSELWGRIESREQRFQMDS